MSKYLFRLAIKSDWENAKKAEVDYEGEILDKNSGFFHLSTALQAKDTA